MAVGGFVLSFPRLVMRYFPKRVGTLALGGTGLLLAGLAGLALWTAWRAWREAAATVAVEARIPFATNHLDPRPDAGLEWISVPAEFRDAAFFRGHVFLAGSAGLFEYSGTGELLARYRVGLELPPAPLVALASGVGPEGNAPELFVATAGEGLLVFDGQSFRQVRPESAPYRKVTAILPLATGRLLLGTEKGVVVYDGEQLATFHPTLSGVPVTALAGNESGLWVGTRDRGVWHWKAGELRRFGEEEGLPDPRVLSLEVIGETAYVGTPLGVAEFRGGQFSRVLAEGFFARSLLRREDTLVVGTLEEGALEVPLQTRPGGGPRPQGQSGPSLVERLLEVEGRLLALGEDGLYAAEEGRGAWAPVILREGALLADSNISALGVDSAGRVWVGYFDRGLDIVDPAGSRVEHIENDYVFCINRIVPDSDRGLTAVATANGLVLFDASGRQRQVLARPEGLIASHVTDIAWRPGGMVVATPAGLTFVDSRGMRSLYAFHGLVNNHAYALASSGDQLLVGTLGGLSVLQGDEIRESYTTANSGLPHNWITAIAAVGRDWFVGTYGAGILRLDSTGHWQNFPDATGPFEVNLNAIVTTDDRVLVGTLGRGLYIFDRAKERWTAVTAGLPSTNVTAVAVYGPYVYVGTDNGLVRFLKENLREP